MKLRSRIMIITFLIILFVQGLNCFLEIGFLANNLETANLRKYRIVGTEMKRKLDKSLIFGKPLTNLNYDRLLSDILPKDMENLYIIGTDGNILYSARKESETARLTLSATFMNEKTPEAYRIFFPLKDRHAIQGNLVIVVSHKEVKEKRLYLIRKSIFNFLIILAISLPALYAMLTVFINRPYNKYIRDLENSLRKDDYERLKESGLDLSPLARTETTLKEIRSAKWLSPDKTDVYNLSDADADFRKRLYNKLKSLMQVN
ncbi:MAG: hypothetical protein MI802_18230 [Desulfobacterales bacterium]|nr:hypothetical protein [Desulfobacterales bacterium]